ncbi:MAG: ABC transporter permease [Rhodospirillaceae bacterium]|jgi:peptide/nickel transport system permease protein
MTRYILNRIGQTAIVIAIMSFVIYGLIGLMPGDPIDLMIAADPKMTSADAAELRELYGLDKPIYERYWNWALAALEGDLGYSRLYAQPVLDVLWPALANTLILLGLTMFFSIIIGLPLGIIAALKPYSKVDYFVNFLAFGGISTPSFWLALLLIIFFSVQLGILPASAMVIGNNAGFWEHAAALALPVMTLTIHSIASYSRHMRSNMIEIMRRDYIRTARAKGSSEQRVVLKHALRNALIPVVTIFGLDFGTLFSGALVTETIFAYPGMGKLIFDSIMGNDFNMALIALLFATLMTMIGNLLADLGYGWLDPRISYQGNS